MNPEEFVVALQKKGIILNKTQLEQFDNYFRLLIEWNEKVNLTRITLKEDVYLKHFYDSISAAFYYDFSQSITLCDVGVGAGFPSIPLKICFPHIKLTIVDSLKKRIDFLEHVADELKLVDVHFQHDRAEDFGSNLEYRESFDVVTARAVARMSVLSELCLPLNKQGGVFIAMKGTSPDTELKEATKSINVLGGQVKQIDTFQLPIEKSERSIIKIEKKKGTPKKYPRKAGTPNKSPIK